MEKFQHFCNGMELGCGKLKCNEHKLYPVYIISWKVLSSNHQRHFVVQQNEYNEWLTFKSHLDLM